MTGKELFQTFLMWVEIDRRTQERLATIRAELAILASREEPKPDMLRVKLY